MTVGEPLPWAAPGWPVEMTAWIDGCLATVGTRRRGPVREVRAWARSWVVTFATDRGRMWAKAVPAVFAHEIAVTSLLADIDPGVVPPVVAADVALGRIITVHVEGPALASVRGEPAAWAATLSRLAELQRVLTYERAALAAAGVAAAPLPDLAEAVPHLLADNGLLLVDRPGGLSTAEATALRDRVPELVATCRELAASGVPDSLEHGDLSAEEVILGEMGPVFLDWSDGSITHPFLSATSLLGHLTMTGAAAVDDDLAAAYLGPWLGAGLGLDEAAGRRAMAAARIVLPLHVAALYAGRILPAIGGTSETARLVPDGLRAILPG
jgi:phosphotransferase family enzyme